MKKILILLFLAVNTILLTSCNNKKTSKPETVQNQKLAPEKLGQIIFENKGNCVACHQIDKKIIGPSIQEIAKIYKEKKGNMVLFLKGEASPLVDPSQYEVMKTNFTITKSMTDQELQFIESYVYSNLK